MHPTFELHPKSLSTLPIESSITEIDVEKEMKEVPFAGVIPVFSRMVYGVLEGVGNGYLEVRGCF